MKKITLLLCALCIGICGCQKFDPTDIWDNINSLDDRVTTLEKLCKEMNTNIEALQTLVKALQEQDYITNVAPIKEDNEVIGYTISFVHNDSITIYHGKDGEDGAAGAPGQDGADGSTPVVGVSQDTDGIYYWTVNGAWLLDADGQKVKAVGVDGTDGTPGQDGSDGKPGQDGAAGADGITPQFKIEEGMWYVSYDDGLSWAELGQATGEKGEQGEKGPQGDPGVGGDSMFTNVDYSTSPDYVIFSLNNGTEFRIPTWSAFESLQTLCNQMNDNIKALQTIVTALQTNDYVTGITPIYDGTTEIGYVINFSQSGSVTIYHGKDGEDGAAGTPGQDGADGSTPVVGVSQDTDGIYYWTVNGAWLLDADGQKVKAVGVDGKDGQNGTDGTPGQDGSDGQPGQDGAAGADGITPQFKIEEGMWYVSYDDGLSWTELGQATGEKGEQGEKGDSGADGDSFFQSVTHDSDSVYLVLADGTEISIPKHPIDAVTMTIGEVTGFTATFNGNVNRKSLDLMVTVYYGTTENLTVYKHTGSTSVTEFEEDAFTLKVTGLAANTTYYYFIETVCNGAKTFSEIASFKTGEPDAYVDWEDGENVGGSI